MFTPSSIMSSQQQQTGQQNNWCISSTKHVKIIPSSMRILFQRMLPSGKRGLSISWNAFSQMKDVSLRPYQKVVVSLEENVFLNSYANKTIHLYKHCTSKDNKACIGGQFFFTYDEWSYFWSQIYDDIYNYVNR